jgi:hypothetical protein
VALIRVKSPARDAIVEAWDAYRTETARVPEYDYEDREPFAWRRLQKRLREIREYEEYTSR